MNYAFDCHMHLLPVNHVPLSAYLEFAKKNSMAEAYAQAAAQNYIATGILKRQGDVLNIVAVAERSAAEELMLYEDDLRGLFASVASPNEKEGLSHRPVITDSGVQITAEGKNLTYEKLVLCPQVMDFYVPGELSIYYKTPVPHDLLKQARDILDGIEEYHEKRPDGKLEIMPFLGINPINYRADYIQEVLETAFAKKSIFGKKKASFAGLKVYPPMGFDPNPEDGDAKAKTEIFFTFAEEHQIPIVTHCDDQGFRMLSLEDSFTFTSPERWEGVLERHPNLWLDFAHFGQQYYRGIPLTEIKKWPEILRERLNGTEMSWQQRIIALMKKYPHVYSDLSFGGSDEKAWSSLNEVLAQNGEDRSKIEARLLFGTDWPLCLTKIPNALDYWNLFVEGPVSQDLMDKMLNKNPQVFLFH